MPASVSPPEGGNRRRAQTAANGCSVRGGAQINDAGAKFLGLQLALVLFALLAARQWWDTTPLKEVVFAVTAALLLGWVFLSALKAGEHRIRVLGIDVLLGFLALWVFTSIIAVPYRWGSLLPSMTVMSCLGVYAAARAAHAS